MKYICWTIAGVLAVLNIAGITQLSWWLIVGFAVFPVVVYLLLLAILLFAVK